MIELYHNDMSVCAAKVRIVLAEKGLEWKGHTLNLRAGEALKPEYLRLNPNGVVPTLVHDGQVVIESTVICEYLDDVWPETPLRPRDPYARTRMRLWTKQLDEGVHASTGTLSTCIAFRHQHLKKSPDELKRYFDSIPQPDRRERLQKAVEFGMDSPTFAPALRRFDRLIADIDRTLTEGDWLAGDSFSLADVAYTPYMVRLEHLGLDDAFRSRPRVVAWRDRLFARPSFKTAVADWFNAGILAVFEAERESAREKAARILKV
jgi:glutathione S-transferase